MSSTRKFAILAAFTVLCFVLYVVGMFIVMGIGFGVGHLLGYNIELKDTALERMRPFLIATAAILIGYLIIIRSRPFLVLVARLALIEARRLLKIIDPQLQRMKLSGSRR